jgi:protoheme IX farnesyltransferase
VSNKTGTGTIGKVESVGLKLKAKGLFQLLKFRLSSLVAISSVFGYAMAAGSAFVWWELLVIGFGGLMITGAANVLNQVIEKEYDKIMQRTSNRPLPTGVLNNREAITYAMVLMIVGVSMLGWFFNLPTALLGIIGLLSYAFVYTPMKRISPVSVFLGAIPGALPPMIGWVAVTGELQIGAWILFAFQFFWQFPHFWAIAWVQDEDYRKAGFKMLPSSSGKTKLSGMLILLYTACLIPMVYFPFQAGLVGGVGAALLALLGVGFTWPAFKLYQSLDDKPARRLMFFSFLYLPLIQLVFLLG